MTSPDFTALHPELLPTPVIATYDSDGNFQPLYFKTPAGDRTKIENIKWKNEETNSTMFFCCEFMEYDMVKEVVLVYIYSRHRWFIDTKKRSGWGFK